MRKNFQEQFEQFSHQVQRVYGQITKLGELSYAEISVDPQITARHRRLLSKKRSLKRRTRQFRYHYRIDDL